MLLSKKISWSDNGSLVPFLLCSLLFSGWATGKEWRVSTPGEARSAVRAASPGDAVIWENGVYRNQRIDLKGFGSESNPIFIQCETPGQVVFTGKSSLSLAGKHLVIDGLRFENGVIDDGAVIHTQSADGDENAESCRITNCTVLDYEGAGQFVELNGIDHRVDHCHFGEKDDFGALFVVRFRDLDRREIPAHRIDHNLFADVAKGPGDNPNGYETMRIGLGDYRERTGNIMVEANVFSKCDGEIEIISNKTSGNTFRSNTFLKCRGQLTLRHGSGSRVEGNFFLGEEKSGTSGVRITGHDHQVINNFFVELRPQSSSGFWSAVSLMSGDDDIRNADYEQVKRAIVAHNTFYDVKEGIYVGVSDGESGHRDAPEDCVIANNVIKASDRILILDSEMDSFTVKGNFFHGKSTWGNQSGIRNVDPRISIDGHVWRPSSGSPILGAGERGFASIDFEGQARVGAVDAGADEFGKSGVLNVPLFSSNVGPFSETETYPVAPSGLSTLPKVNFVLSKESELESTGLFNLDVNLSGTSSIPVTVPFTLSGTATEGIDYRLTNSPLVIPAGTTRASLELRIEDDPWGEGEETIVVTMKNPTNATLGVKVAHVFTIRDNDRGSPQPPPVSEVSMPMVEFALSKESELESTGLFNLDVNLSGTSSIPVTVPFTLSGTATEGIDYRLTNSPLVIPAGKTRASLELRIEDDPWKEAEETIVVTMKNPTNATLGVKVAHVFTIRDNDRGSPQPPPVSEVSMPKVEFVLSKESELESTGLFNLDVNLSGTSSIPVTVPFTLSGTATEGIDYRLTNSPLVIPAGTTRTSLELRIEDDPWGEGEETIVVTMKNPTNATLGVKVAHVFTIRDNDRGSPQPPPVSEVSMPMVEFVLSKESELESTGLFNLDVNLSGTSSIPVTVPFTLSGTATEGIDYRLTNSPLVIPAGTTRASLELRIEDDPWGEGEETIVVTMKNPTNATLGVKVAHVFTIRDNDRGSPQPPPVSEVSMPMVEFALSKESELESTELFNLDVSLSGTSSIPVTVPFTLSGTATEGIDYRLTNSPLVIPAGTTRASLELRIEDDPWEEGEETIVVTMKNPTNATLGVKVAHVFTIRDNDRGSPQPPPVSEVSMPMVEFVLSKESELESTGLFNLDVNLSGTSSIPVTVPFTLSGTATEGIDYRLTNSPLVIPAGTTRASLELRIEDDPWGEGEETIVVTMKNPTNATLGVKVAHVFTIRDNDRGSPQPPPVSEVSMPMVEFVLSGESELESVGLFSVALRLSKAAEVPIVVPIEVNGTATLGSDFSLSKDSVIFAPGTVVAEVVMEIEEDGIVEGNETVLLSMGLPSNAVLGEITNHRFTIRDLDVVSSSSMVSDLEDILHGADECEKDLANRVDVDPEMGQKTSPCDSFLLIQNSEIKEGRLILTYPFEGNSSEVQVSDDLKNWVDLRTFYGSEAVEQTDFEGIRTIRIPVDGSQKMYYRLSLRERTLQTLD